jgi:hypothetical protein
MPNNRSIPWAIVATAWSAAAVIAGLWALDGGLPAWRRISPAGSACAGGAGVAGGLFVFMALVSDRFFPQAARTVVVATEALTLVAWAACLAMAGALLLTGAPA